MGYRVPSSVDLMTELYTLDGTFTPSLSRSHCVLICPVVKWSIMSAQCSINSLFTPALQEAGGLVRVQDMVMFQASIPDPFSPCRDPRNLALCPTSPSSCYYPAPYSGPIGEEDNDDENNDVNFHSMTIYCVSDLCCLPCLISFIP